LYCLIVYLINSKNHVHHEKLHQYLLNIKPYIIPSKNNIFCVDYYYPAFEDSSVSLLASILNADYFY